MTASPLGRMNEPLSGKRNKLPLSVGSLLGMAGAVNKGWAQRLFSLGSHVRCGV